MSLPSVSDTFSQCDSPLFTSVRARSCIRNSLLPPVRKWDRQPKRDTTRSAAVEPIGASFLTLSGHSDVSVLSSMLPKPKLLAWLTLFSKLSNPKALYSADTLRSLYVTLLSHPDRAPQNMALTCLFTYKSAHLAPFEERQSTGGICVS
ncbi:hypothetical protein HYPSUDRAFT_201431 [Hypholoma sublateritium FD-334 SS-4]|uniref:U3 small nucleolar RNA-associated protein 20 N-terminal domain-containing protein n=1 Tax=Hypholoma sublateritium (strain FD-334 SS-4) TaxID=945553 RepID=A0A0D2L881_HYPSF|nr:hypothetical protein HYPSUDRAFT_201431 [Hypholoma sublateritium FD-334 SS-4]